MKKIDPASKPWYREPWPWILMAGPAIVVVAGIATAWLAVRSNDGLVEDADFQIFIQQYDDLVCP